MAIATPKCDKIFLTSEDLIDLNKLKEYNIKFDDTTINSNFNEYKKNIEQYNQKSFWKKTNCTDYMKYYNPITNNNKKKASEYQSEINNCRIYKTNRDENLKQYTNKLSIGIKKKILSRLNKTLKNPNKYKSNKIACYIKLLIDLLNSKSCKISQNSQISRSSSSNYRSNYRSNISISDILEKFNREYNKSTTEELKKVNSTNYLKYLLTNNPITDKELELYKTLYKDEKDLNEFVKVIESVLKTYNDCI